MAALIDPIFPEGAIHLVAGPTGAGKTRWLMSMLMEWEQGKPVLGFPSNPQPWLYISADREIHEAHDTISSLGINPSNIAMLPAYAPILTESKIFDTVEQLNKRVLVWEGFGSYAGDGANGVQVKQWLSNITWNLRHHRNGTERIQPLTIIGIVEQPKMKPHDRYSNPRQRVSGPAAWGHSTSTICLIEFAEKGCMGPKRHLIICPRNAADMQFNAELKNGHFSIIS